MKSLSKLKCLRSSTLHKEMKVGQYYPLKPPLYQRADNKRPASVAAILQWRLPFCIVQCSVDLFGSLVEHGCEFECYDDAG